MPEIGHVFCYPPVAVDEVRQSPFEREHLPAKPGFKVIVIHDATGRASPLSRRVAHEDHRAADYRNAISRPTAMFLRSDDRRAGKEYGITVRSELPPAAKKSINTLKDR